MKEKLRDRIAKGKTKQIIAELLTLDILNSDLYSRVVHISARFAHYEKQKLGGLEAPSVLGIELRQINVALYDIIDELPENIELPFQNENLTQENSPSVLSSNLAKGMIITFILTTIGFFADVLGIWSFFKGETKAEINSVIKKDTVFNSIPPIKQTVDKPTRTGDDNSKPPVINQPAKPSPTTQSIIPKTTVKIQLIVNAEFEKGDIFINDKQVFPVSETPIFKNLEIEYQPNIKIVVKSGNQSCTVRKMITESELNNQNQIQLTCTQ